MDSLFIPSGTGQGGFAARCTKLRPDLRVVETTPDRHLPHEQVERATLRNGDRVVAVGMTDVFAALKA